jgi:hypothetical protein
MQYRRLTASHIKLIGAKIDGVKSIFSQRQALVDSVAQTIFTIRDGGHLKSVDA